MAKETDYKAVAQQIIEVVGGPENIISVAHCATRLRLIVKNREIIDDKQVEAIDIVKKWLMQGHELDKDHLIKELGDVAWYLAEAATALDVPLETVFQENLDKLHRRFPNGFDTQASVHRKKDDI